MLDITFLFCTFEPDLLKEQTPGEKSDSALIRSRLQTGGELKYYFLTFE